MRNNQQQIARRVIYHEKAFEIQNVSVNINLCNCIEIKQLIVLVLHPSIHHFLIEFQYIFSKGRSLPYCINSMLVKYIGHCALHNTILTTIFFDILHICKEL